jgi:hypothetical protein
MNRITRFFIGPLTEAQLRRRQRARDKFNAAAEIADARYISMRDAFRALHAERHSWMRPYYL